jgi:hypothetical protein
VKRSKLLTTLLVAVLISSTGCGVSDSIKSLELAANGNSVGGSYNLSGVTSVLQLHVQAVYHSGKIIDVTNDSSFSVTVAPLSNIFSTGDPVDFPVGPLPSWGPTIGTISKTGLMTGIAEICTWQDALDSKGNPQTPPAWVYTGYFVVTATYRQFTSQPLGVGMGIATSNSPTGGCGPA